ncbi:hypothetical protein [Nostoc sp.]|uniref:hypothetical protein n=1 Tax=Nostoc sp. TaxID=1180 RepID=UPI002FF9A88A
MHYSPQIKILDLDNVESITKQEITLAEAEKIVGGGKSSNVSISISSYTSEVDPTDPDPIDIPPPVIPRFLEPMTHTPSGGVSTDPS